MTVVMGSRVPVLVTPDATALADGATERELAAVMAALGIPGEPSVTVTVIDEPVPGDRPLLLAVNGALCLYPARLVLEVCSTVLGQPRAAAAVPPDLDAPAAASLISLICREAVKWQPAVLLTPAGAEYYCREAGIEPGAVPAAIAHEVLRGAVGLGHSIADQETVRRVLTSGGPSALALREKLLAELGGASLTLQVEPGYLRQLTTAYADNAGVLASLRQSMLSDLHAVPPALRLTACDTLPPGTFRLRVNDLESLPVPGLPAGSLAVTGTVAQLRELGIEAEPSRFANGVIIAEASRPEAEAAGLPVGDQLEYLYVCVMEIAHDLAGRLVDRIQAEKLLALTGQVNSWLADVARKILDTGSLTAVLRELVADSVPVRDLRPVLETLIDLQLAGDEPARAHEDRVNAVRAALSETIAVQALQGQASIQVILLDPAFEEQLTASAPATAETADAADHTDTADSWLPADASAALIWHLATQVGAELAKRPPDSPMPALLTGKRARSLVRSALRPEFPELRVISYDDLPFPVSLKADVVITGDRPPVPAPEGPEAPESQPDPAG